MYKNKQTRDILISVVDRISSSATIERVTVESQ